MVRSVLVFRAKMERFRGKMGPKVGGWWRPVIVIGQSRYSFRSLRYPCILLLATGMVRYRIPRGSNAVRDRPQIITSLPSFSSPNRLSALTGGSDVLERPANNYGYK